ncbi:hypothetical protein [Pseudomonas syringae]|uniref:hypothetical protein n=1 Tax=Pseudomonas syringae TaxID=317 RepID=UPI001F4158CC|nr:hypothetical protein [Pseudomonas syringae]MCF5721591.1 hypothetical protein [Pseudomonas syringae]
MYINNAGFSESVPLASQAQTPADINGTSDINFFNAHMNPTSQSANKIAPSMTTNQFNVGALESTAVAKRVKRGMRDTLLSKQTKEAHALPESLAAANLDVVARVKMLGLLVKGVDKIATMG